MFCDRNYLLDLAAGGGPASDSLAFDEFVNCKRATKISG